MTSLTLDRAKQKSRSGRQDPDPTGDQFGAYGQVFDYFNRILFDGHLPRIILNFSRRAKSMGFFAAERWRQGAEHTHEISLNPDVLDRPLLESMQTLVHEMVHLWQHEFGRPSRRGYHNSEWAGQMEVIGLMPSTTGKPGGGRTGQKMSDYVIEGGPFDNAFRAMPPEYQLPWSSGGPVRKPNRNDKVKYVCRSCGRIALWGKAGQDVACRHCGERLQWTSDARVSERTIHTRGR
jgi:predicted SprT family Zn-dependent metalloprotease